MSNVLDRRLVEEVAADLDIRSMPTPNVNQAGVIPS
jgi:hypothetical protein